MADTFDLVIIDAGEAGQAAADLARDRGASVAIVDRELFGGSCPFWACMPSKALLHPAAIHVRGGDPRPGRRLPVGEEWLIELPNRMSAIATGRSKPGRQQLVGATRLA